MYNYRCSIFISIKYLPVILSIFIITCVNFVFVPVTKAEEKIKRPYTIYEESGKPGLIAAAEPADANQKSMMGPIPEPNKPGIAPWTMHADVNQERGPKRAKEPNEVVIPDGAAPANREQFPATPRPANPSVNSVTLEAVRLGVLSCVSRINQVASFITANTLSGVFIFPVHEQPDQHIFSTSFELLRADDSTIYATASFFPNSDAVYETVEYVEVECGKLERTVFKNLKRVGVVKKNIVMLDGGDVKVFLMPAGSGCVVIKKEVVK